MRIAYLWDDDFRPAVMPRIYEHVFEQFRIVGSDDRSIAD
jgi:hypothetical protein